MKPILAALVTPFVCAATYARVETVLVKKVMDDKAIIVRSNGESFLIEKGVGCLSLWRFEGKRAYISSPGIFLGAGSRLLLPDIDQECRIWDSEPLGSELPYSRPVPRVAPSPSSPTSDLVVAIQKALNIVGYSVVVDGTMTEQTRQAFAKYQLSKGYAPTASGIRMTLLSLASDVAKRQPTPTDAYSIAARLYRAAQVGAGTSVNRGCIEGHWISSVTDSGKLIKLEDGSLWAVDPADTVYSMLWLPTEALVVCGGILINSDNGEKVRASLLK